MINTIIHGLVCVLLLRWMIWGTTRLFEQEEVVDHICYSGLQESQDEAKLLTCLLHNGLSE